MAYLLRANIDSTPVQTFWGGVGVPSTSLGAFLQTFTQCEQEKFQEFIHTSRTRKRHWKLISLKWLLYIFCDLTNNIDGKYQRKILLAIQQSPNVKIGTWFSLCGYIKKISVACDDILHCHEIICVHG